MTESKKDRTRRQPSRDEEIYDALEELETRAGRPATTHEIASGLGRRREWKTVEDLLVQASWTLNSGGPWVIKADDRWTLTDAGRARLAKPRTRES